MVTHPPTPSLLRKEGEFKVPFLFERERDLGNGFQMVFMEDLCVE